MLAALGVLSAEGLVVVFPWASIFVFFLIRGVVVDRILLAMYAGL